MKSSNKIILIIIMTLFMGAFAMPQSWKEIIPISKISQFLQTQQLHLGLDLQGGTQLDYIIDLRQAKKYNEDNDPKNDVDIRQIIEGVRTTLMRRIDGLGVKEPNIYTANIADEHHIIVELAGVNDVEEAKKIVGKTIQLEFKEQREEIENDKKDEIKVEAEKTLTNVKSHNKDFRLIGEKLKTSDEKITYDSFTQFKDEINEEIRDQIWNLAEGEIFGELLEINQGYEINEFQQVHQKTGFAILKAGKKEIVKRTSTKNGEDFEKVAKEVLKDYQDKQVNIDYYPNELREKIQNMNVNDISEVVELPEKYVFVKLINKEEQKEQVKVSQILVSYSGASNSTQERTKLQAKKRAEEIIGLLKEKKSDFSAIAKEYSDSKRMADGDMGFLGKDSMHPEFNGKIDPEFEKVAFGLKMNEISDIIETPFGFHIIKKTDEKKTKETVYTTYKISVAKEDGAKSKIDTLRTRVLPREVTEKEPKLSYERIFYSTVPDPWKPTGLDGSKFQRATMSFDQFGKPVVVIEFDTEGAKLFGEITERNIGKPVAIFVGGNLISSPTVNEKIPSGSAQITGRFNIPEAARLAQDLNTGAISAPIILIGQHKIGATLGTEALRTSVYAGIIGLIMLVFYMVAQYRAFGFIASIALSIYAIILLFILKSSGIIGIPIILTLAGIAGLILSIGMAVDANILIFERIKEEINEGKSLRTAIAIGFERAWTSIRDSNVSSLITCFILAQFGTSIIRGFAINLAIGIFVSMFTALTITRAFLDFLFANAKKSPLMLGGLKKDK